MHVLCCDAALGSRSRCTGCGVQGMRADAQHPATTPTHPPARSFVAPSANPARAAMRKKEKLQPSPPRSPAPPLKCEPVNLHAHTLPLPLTPNMPAGAGAGADAGMCWGAQVDWQRARQRRQLQEAAAQGQRRSGAQAQQIENCKSQVALHTAMHFCRRACCVAVAHTRSDAVQCPAKPPHHLLWVRPLLFVSITSRGSQRRRWRLDLPQPPPPILPPY